MVRINLGFRYRSNVVWFRGLIEALIERGEKPLVFFLEIVMNALSAMLC